jgi:hypothetical protein
MTTESKKDPRSSGSRVLLGAALSALALGVGATVVGGVASGSAAAYGALAGTLLVLVVFGFGGVVVDTVAGLMPAASLLVALLTYTLQVVLMGLVFAGLSRSGLLDDTLDRAWLAGVVIAGTFGWLLTQVVLTTRLRIPAYEPVLTDARGADQGGDRA